jgi:hypothetical protein
MGDDEEIYEAARRLMSEHGVTSTVEDRSLHIPGPVKGDAAFAVLNAVAVGQDASPVGAATYGPAGGAMAVWSRPTLLLARYVKGRRSVVSYRIPGGSSLTTYLRTEGHIPTRLEAASWYAAVPDDVSEAFLSVGLLLDEPPFPVQAAPPPVSRSAPSRAPATTARPSSPRPAPVRPAAKTDQSRVCPECGMRKGPTQFVAGSDLCVDCR